MANANPSPATRFGAAGAGAPNVVSRAAARMRQAVYRRLTKEKAEAIADALFAEAAEGNIAAIREVFDRVWGKAIQPVDVTVHEERTLAIIAMTEAQIAKLQEFNAETRAALTASPKLIDSSSSPAQVDGAPPGDAPGQSLAIDDKA